MPIGTVAAKAHQKGNTKSAMSEGTHCAATVLLQPRSQITCAADVESSLRLAQRNVAAIHPTSQPFGQNSWNGTGP